MLPAMGKTEISPEQFGIARSDLSTITVSDSAGSLEMIRGALGGEPGPAADMIALNAGATIYAGDLAGSIEEGVSIARNVLNNKSGLEKLSHLAEVSNSFN